MAVTKPYFRTARQLADGSYQLRGNGRYVSDARFAIAGCQYVRAFLLLQKDILELFEFVEPADVNLPCYSFRIHGLHMRMCIEVEANCKAILSENGYARAGDWNMADYRRLNATHHLSSYQVRTPIWNGTSGTRSPFAPWAQNGALSWYKAYNDAKHDRHNQFALANFENLLDAFCGLVALLSAQFIDFDFQPAVYGPSGGSEDGFDTALGGYFHVKFPTDWAANERYEFNWEVLKEDPDPFQRLTF